MHMNNPLATDSPRSNTMSQDGPRSCRNTSRDPVGRLFPTNDPSEGSTPPETIQHLQPPPPDHPASTNTSQFRSRTLHLPGGIMDENTSDEDDIHFTLEKSIDPSKYTHLFQLKPKLTATNYATWTGVVLRALQTVALHVYLNPDFTLPRGNTAETKHHPVRWQKANLFVCSILTVTMSEEIQDQIGHLPTAVEIWAEARRLCAGTAAMDWTLTITLLVTTHYTDGEDVTAHIARMKGYRQDLILMHRDLDDELFACFLRVSMPSTWNHVFANLPDHYTSTEVERHIRDEYGVRTSQSAGTSFQATRSNRTRTKRSDRHTEANKVALSQQGEGSGFGAPGTVPILGATLEPVVPLEMSANRWIASSAVHKSAAADTDPPEVADRKVRALLNKLTMQNFDSISDQIIAWANTSENEKDGRTLILVIRLVFKNVTNEAAWSEMYAHLCRKMMERINPEVQDDGIRNTEGKPITGGQLFRKYLLNRCQEDFERGWVAKEAAAKASDDQAIKAANKRKGDESELYPDEYYAAQRAKRQGLGLIKFIGELFKLQMLTERIMHECVKKFLGNVENPEEEEIESLCQLLKTVGQLLDVPKARAHMDVYFTRMKELCESLNVSPRRRFMLQDVIELRDRKWASRGAVIAPTTISAVHEAAAKEKVAAEAQSYQRQLSMFRGGLRRGGDRNLESGPDDWTMAGSSVAWPQSKAGDLSQFGKINKAAPMVMGPSSVFTKKDNKCDSLSRSSSNSNMFHMLSQNPELAVDPTAKSSRPPSRKPPVDLGQGGAPEPAQRKKLQLLPRSKPTPAEETPPPASEDEPEVPVQMSEAEAKKKIDEDVEEFFAVRSLDEADVYFTNLPEEHRFHLVDKLVTYALESKEADAVLVSEFFAQAAFKGQCSFEVFEAGFMPMAEFLDDIAIDAPNAFKFMAIMLKGAYFDKDEERLTRIARKSMDSDKLFQLVSS